MRAEIKDGGSFRTSTEASPLDSAVVSEAVVSAETSLLEHLITLITDPRRADRFPAATAGNVNLKKQYEVAALLIEFFKVVDGR